MEKMIEFVGSVPCLSQISKGGVTKIVRSLNKKKYVKNQKVTTEGFGDLVELDRIGNSVNDFQYRNINVSNKT